MLLLPQEALHDDTECGVVSEYRRRSMSILNTYIEKICYVEDDAASRA